MYACLSVVEKKCVCVCKPLKEDEEKQASTFSELRFAMCFHAAFSAA